MSSIVPAVYIWQCKWSLTLKNAKITGAMKILDFYGCLFSKFAKSRNFPGIPGLNSASLESLGTSESREIDIPNWQPLCTWKCNFYHLQKSRLWHMFRVKFRVPRPQTLITTYIGTIYMTERLPHPFQVFYYITMRCPTADGGGLLLLFKSQPKIAWLAK